MVSIGILTSSRADFGVYLPLLKKIINDPDFKTSIIAFGSHNSISKGKTINEIYEEGFEVDHILVTTIDDDSEEAISTSAALTTMKFSQFWSVHQKDFDLVLCLGDRYEMFAAVSAAVPYGIKFAHFYGGGYTHGVIDNFYRDSITHASSIHFTSTQKNAEEIKLLTRNKDSIDVIGILSLSTLADQRLYSIKEFKEKWGINLDQPTIVIAFHPETVNPQRNEINAKVVAEVIIDLIEKYQIIATMPNTDTNSSFYWDEIKKIDSKFHNRIHLIENFGVKSYFTCLEYSDLLVGNSSSGISEASSFGKYFINVGDRQLGREYGPNVISTKFDKSEILNAIYATIKLGKYKGPNIYKKDEGLDIIINKLKLTNSN